MRNLRRRGMYDNTSIKKGGTPTKMLNSDIPPGRVIFDGAIKFLVEVWKQAVAAILVHHAIHGGPKVMAGVWLVGFLEGVLLGKLFETELGRKQAGKGGVQRGGDHVADSGNNGIRQMIICVP